MEEILQLEVSGKFNGQDATLSVGLVAEQPMQIEDVSTAAEDDAVGGGASADTATQESHTEPAPDTTSEPSDENAGLDELFPDEEGVDEDDLPPLSTDTKQYTVAKEIQSHADPINVRNLTDALVGEYGEEEWSDSIVTSHLNSLREKGIVDREKNDSSGKWEYFISELGEVTIERVEQE